MWCHKSSNCSSFYPILGMLENLWNAWMHNEHFIMKQFCLQYYSGTLKDKVNHTVTINFSSPDNFFLFGRFQKYLYYGCNLRVATCCPFWWRKYVTLVDFWHTLEILAINECQGSIMIMKGCKFIINMRNNIAATSDMLYVFID